MTQSKTTSRRDIARAAAELIFPIGAAALPFGLVFEQTLPSWAIEGVFILLTLFATAMVATYAPLPVGSVVIACTGLAIVALAQRPNLFAITLIPLVAFVLRWTEVRKLVRRFVIASVVLFIVVVGLYFVAGFNSGNDLYAWRTYSGEFVTRLSLGFSHPNRVMMEWVVILVGILGFVSAKGRARWFIPLAAGTVYLFTVTDSRTSGYLAAGFLLIALALRNRLDRPVVPFARGLAIAAPVLATLASFLLALAGATPALNAILTGRPTIYAKLLDEYSLLAPFGHASVEDAIVDNGYLHLFLSKGILLAVMYLTILTVLIATPRRMSVRSFFIVGVFLALSLAETNLLNFALLFLVLATLEIDRREDFTEQLATEPAYRGRGRRLRSSPRRLSVPTRPR